LIRPVINVDVHTYSS